MESTSTIIENFNANHGLAITLYGIMFVFWGIVIIQMCMIAFNHLFVNSKKDSGKNAFKDVPKMPIPDVKDEYQDDEVIPTDHLVAIFVAIELYRRLHFDRLPSQITFKRGQDAANAWQSGSHFGHRNR